ncbi:MULTISPECIES: O-antigen polymerase [unclassified Acinetobacter]|uniref:O-antigen polymerase n=1 Tax=unclassified Acinetobacter TaxID=196816 RepID=UPI0015D15D78|nr:MULTISPECIES: O-antigen polymerase [unclassified Acinetobacter]
MKIKVYNLFFLLGSLFTFISLIYLMELKIDIVGFSFIFNILVSIFLLFFSLKSGVRVILFYSIFNLMFMSFIPYLNYTENVLIWVNNDFNNFDYIYTNIIIFVFNIIVFVSYFYSSKSFYFIGGSGGGQSNSFNNGKTHSQIKALWVILVSILCFLILFYAKNFDFYRMLVRGIEGDVYESSHKNPLLSIIIMICRLIPAFLLMRLIVEKRYYLSYFVFFILLICNFPSAIPRFLVGFIYLPLLLLIFPNFRKPVNIALTLILSIVFVFPFLNQFRYFSKDQKISFVPELSFFNQAHFDAYQNLADVLRSDFVTYGYQLLGPMFFYIPRSLWESKPYGSGYQLAMNNNYTFSNISMPFIGEAYINFSYFGIVFFALILGFLMKNIDMKYLLGNIINYNYCKGLFLCSAVFFLLRGDLMSSFYFLICGIISFKIVEKI